MQTFRFYLEAGLFGFGWRALRLLSPEASSALGTWLYRTIGPRLHSCHIARDSMRRAFPEVSEDQFDHWLDGMWGCLGATFFETPHLADIATAANRVKIEGQEILNRLRAEGQPALFFSGHLGNYLTIPAVLAKEGMTIKVVLRLPQNLLPYKIFGHFARDMCRRGDGDVGFLPKNTQGSKQAMDTLRRGQSVFMAVDHKTTNGLLLPFFGRNAVTAPGLAKLALRFGAPVVPIRSIREGAARLRVMIEEPLTVAPTESKAEFVQEMMTQVNATLERWIRERPAEWTWNYRRWPKE